MSISLRARLRRLVQTGLALFALCALAAPALAAAPIQITTASLPNGTVGISYNGQIGLSGGGALPYSVHVTAGALPEGVTLIDGNGALVGRPREYGAFTFSITATDSTTPTPSTDTKTYTITIAPPAMTMTPTTLPNSQVGANYFQIFQASGGFSPHTYTISSGALPAGLTLNTAGVLTGTVAAGGVFNFGVTAIDNSGHAYGVTQMYTITIAPPTVSIYPTSLPDPKAGVAYNVQIDPSGGIEPYSFAVTAGALPAGLALNPTTGVISGATTALGPHSFTITATDSASGTGPYSAAQAYTVNVVEPTIALTPATLPNPTAGAAYSQALTASGGAAPYSYAFTAGSLPAGLTFSADGVISGTPTFAGPVSITVRATDRNGYFTERTFIFTVRVPAFVVAPTSLTDATVASTYSQALTVSGGTAPYSYTIFAGSLPAGLTLSAGGVISGTPTAGGVFNITIIATDSTTGPGSPYFTSRNYALTVNGPTLAMTPSAGALPAGQAGVAYTPTSFAASGGTASYSYAITAGSLPAGLTLSSAGLLSGTPSVSGAFNFSVTATDSSTGTGPFAITQAYSIALQQAVPTISSLAPAIGPAGGGQAVTITGTNFTNASAVTFGGTAAAAFTVNSATSITATTPAHASGAVSVAVTTPGGTATASNAYTYQDPGAVRFVVNNMDDGAYVFTSPTPALNFTVTTSGGSGASAAISLAPGSYALSFTTPAGTGLTAASCSPSTSSVNIGAQSAALTVASNVTTVCTIEALPSRRATVEALGAALDASSRLILANAPDLSRRLARLNGGGASSGSASAFGKTFAAGLPFSASIGASELRFAMSLSGLRARGDDDHRFNAPANANANGVPASLAASSEAASGVAVTEAASAAASSMASRSYRFDAWVEGTLARFNGAASSDGDFAILHAGMDYLVSDDLLLGVAIQADWLDMDTATGSLKSDGWLAGPYLTARFSENLYLDLRAAWGGASFDVSPFGTYTDTVDSDRSLYTAALIGEFEAGHLTIRPEARVTWYRETTDPYIDSLSVAIPEVEIKTGEVTFGPTFTWTIQQPGGATLRPSFGFDLVWTFQQDNTATAFTGAPGLDDTGLRARIEGGLDYQSAGGVTAGASLFYDGIGGGDYDAWGGRAHLSFGF